MAVTAYLVDILHRITIPESDLIHTATHREPGLYDGRHDSKVQSESADIDIRSQAESNNNNNNNICINNSILVLLLLLVFYIDYSVV